MMTFIVLATSNRHKVHEFRQMLEAHSFEIVTPDDRGLRLTVDETGQTFEENAQIKAEAHAAASDSFALADDSGLVVDAMDGAPGILSARFGGAGATDEDRNALVLSRMIDVPVSRRSARFVAAIAIAGPQIETRMFRGVVEGRISDRARGNQGFGYDPIFLYPPYQATFGEVSPARKNAVSHRARALSLAVDHLETLRLKGILG
ncbi:MAG: XTP/dITP diphosphatase [Chloroflexota bacterium]